MLVPNMGQYVAALVFTWDNRAARATSAWYSVLQTTRGRREELLWVAKIPASRQLPFVGGLDER